MHIAKWVGLGLVASSFFIICMVLLKKNEPFFNLREIAESHFAFLQKSNAQFLIFTYVPLLFAIGLSLLYTGGAAFYSDLSVVLGILLSMLLASLSILSNYDFEKVEDEAQRKKGKAVVRDTINAILFDSILCVALLLYGLTIIVLSNGSYEWLPFDLVIVKTVISGIAYYIFTVILLNLLLVFKQMSNIIEFSILVKKE